MSDLDFWFSEVEAQLSSGDTGRDLGGVQTLLKKHQLVEADIDAHQVHVLYRTRACDNHMIHI